MKKYYLGIDLGGTKVKIAIVDNRGKIIEEAEVAESRIFSPKDLIRRIMLEAKGLKYYKKISGIGVGVAGDIDQKKKKVRFSPNLKKWRNVPLGKMLKKYFKGPVIIDNDANAAALGALFLDAKGRAKNLICITLGTGVGGGIIIDGKIYHGATGTAGEIGHMHYEVNGPKCNCPSYGCIEKYIGASALKEQGKKVKSKIINKLCSGNKSDITPKLLYEAALLGDAGAIKIWREAGVKLGVVFANLINILNPEIIVISGGISKANSLLLGPLKKTVEKRAFKTPAKACRIIASKYTNRLGVVGAALLAM